MQKLLSSVSTGLKNTPQPLLFVLKRHTATALLTNCYRSRGAVVSVVSAFRVHFLTIINNYSIFQITSSYALNSFGRAIRGVCFCCSFPRSGCKVTRL